MIRYLIVPILSVLFLAGWGSLSHAPAETLNRVVAVVNNEVITLHELNKRIRELTGMTPEDLRKRGEQAFLEGRKDVLDLMIDEKIAEEKVRELGIRISQKQVDEAVERVKRDNRWTQEDLVARLQREGLSYEKYAEKVKKDLERIQLINAEVKSKILISDEKVKRYYEEHKAEFSTDAKVRLAGIFLVRKNPRDNEESQDLIRKGEEILERLRKGEDFGQLAKAFSDGPGADEGGDLGVFQSSKLEPELQKVVEKLQPGGVSGLMVRPNGIQILKLVSKDGGTGKSLEDVREAIYNILYQEDVNDRYATWIRQLREGSYIKINF